MSSHLGGGAAPNAPPWRRAWLEGTPFQTLATLPRTPFPIILCPDSSALTNSSHLSLITSSVTHYSCVPIRRLHPPKCVFEGRLCHGDATKDVPIQRLRPMKTSFVGRLRHGGATKTVPIHDASSEGCIPRPIASPRRDECWRNSKATSNAPSVSQENEGYIRWILCYPRIHSATVTTGLIFKQNSR